MSNPQGRPVERPRRRRALITLGLLGVALLGLGGLWWRIAIRPQQITIPNPALPKPNAFDFYVAAGNALVNTRALWNSVGTNSIATLAQKEALLRQNAGVIDKLHQGFAHPYLEPPCRSNDAAMPYYAKFRDIARLLWMQGDVRSGHGDWGGAMESYLDAVRMGEDIPHGAILIGQLTGISCQSIGRRPIWKAIDHLNAMQARAAALRLESIRERHFAFADTLEEEKRWRQAILLELDADPHKRDEFIGSYTGNHSSRFHPEALPMLFSLTFGKEAVMNNFTAYMDQSSEQARRPYALHLPPVPLPPDAFNQNTIPVFSTARLKEVDDEALNGLVAVMLALHAFQLEHGRYPAGLAELTPAYLKRLPDDPFAQQGTFRYRITGNTYTLYSLGPDGNDDGGKPIDDLKQIKTSNANARYFVNEHSVGDVVAGKNIF